MIGENKFSRASLSALIIRLMVGVVFSSEGLQKFLYPDELGSGRFAKIGIPFPETLGPTVGGVEMLCGLLIIAGFFTRYAVLPLMVVMLCALVSTKLPVLLGHEVFGFSRKELPRYGLLSMVHEARTDLCMICGLVYLWLVVQPEPCRD